MKKLWLLIILQLIISINFLKAGYSEEFPQAYTWAFSNWITTQDTIEKANMYWEITRIELSKMISNYAINILNKKLDTSKKCEFEDISDKLNKQYDSWVTKACQLWLMWQWITKFRPNDKVTRAEFGTILSRLLYWDKYNWWTPYYKKHLNQLNIRWIMTNISNPEKWNEIRGNVMVMLKRSEKLWSLEIPTFEELDDVVTACEYEDVFWEEWDTYRENITKQEFIIPYKDWYFWYTYWWQDWIWFYITYTKPDNPCSTFLISDEIFTRNPHYNYYKEMWYNSEYWDNYLFYSRWEEYKKAKTLNCKAWEDICFNEAKKYLYNLIIWTESDEYFSLQMNYLKKIIDNNSDWTGIYIDRSDKFYDCVDNIVWERPDNIYIISEDEKEQLRCKSIKSGPYCVLEYIDACSGSNRCEKLKQEINNCNMVKN